MLKYYYIDKFGVQHGPIELSELSNRGINSKTPIWHEGLSEWEDASKISELSGILEKIPPVFSRQMPPPPISEPIFRQMNSASYGQRQYSEALNKTNHQEISKKTKKLIILSSVFAVIISPIIFAFIGSIMSAKPQTPAFFIAIPLSIYLFIIFKGRRMSHLRRKNIFLLPILALFLSGGVYYGVITKCHSFSYGVARIKFADCYGVINRFGIPIIPFDYTYIHPTKYGNFDLFDGKLHGIMNRRGEVILPCQFNNIYDRADIYIVKKNGFYGIYSKDGILKLEPKYSHIAKNYFHGLALINKGGYQDSKNRIKGGKWGYIDILGNIVIDCKYETICTYEEEGYIKGKNGNIEDKYDIFGNFIETQNL